MILFYLDTVAYHRLGSLFEGKLRKEFSITDTLELIGCIALGVL